MKLVIAGGGTGGHVYPGIAVAQALKHLDLASQVLFVGTELGLEKSAVPKAGFEIQYIRASGIKGRSLFKKLRSFIEIPFAVFTSLQILRKAQADAVIGVGGYASGPVLLAAWILRIPIAIIEPNSIPGFTNRILGYLSRRIFGAFYKTGRFFPKKRFLVVGSPLRESFAKTAQTFKAREKSADTPPQLVIFGGSLGAHPLNNVTPEALALLHGRGIGFRVMHQTGVKDETFVRQKYQTLGITADVRPFVDDVVSAYLIADLVICRAGAATCAEITAIGLPSIFIPFPHAIYDHQTENARELAETGAAILLPQSEMTDERLADEIYKLISKPGYLKTMADAAKKLGKKDAAEQIAKSALNRFSNQVF